MQVYNYTHIYYYAYAQNKPFCIDLYRNKINTVNQLQLNYSTNMHLLIPWFMKSLCVITIKLNTLRDVLYQMTVGGAFVHVCENLWKSRSS